MHQLRGLVTGATHQHYDLLLRATGRRRAAGAAGNTAATDDRDRGAVSLEQVLWFVAAGLAVAGIAVVIYSRIRDEAENIELNTTDPLSG